MKPKLSPFLGIDLIHEIGNQSKLILECRDLLQKLVIYGIHVYPQILCQNEESSLRVRIFKCLVCFVLRIIILGIEQFNQKMLKSRIDLAGELFNSIVILTSIEDRKDFINEIIAILDEITLS